MCKKVRFLLSLWLTCSLCAQSKVLILRLTQFDESVEEGHEHMEFTLHSHLDEHTIAVLAISVELKLSGDPYCDVKKVYLILTKVGFLCDLLYIFLSCC